MSFLKNLKSFILSKKENTKVQPLVYDSFAAWKLNEQIPDDWTQCEDQPQRDKWWRQFTEVKNRIWALHIDGLTTSEQQQFADGTHPSLSHDFADLALPFCDLLKNDLLERGIESKVTIGRYHMGRIVLIAKLDRIPPDSPKGELWLYKGFEVKMALSSNITK